MAIEFNHETNDIVNSTGLIKLNGTAVGGDNSPVWYGSRGIFAGGGSYTDVIQYITIANTGDATDFGDLTESRSAIGSCSDSSRGVFGGGNPTSSNATNVIDYITIASTGDAIDYGDLPSTNAYPTSASDSHGGLQSS